MNIQCHSHWNALGKDGIFQCQKLRCPNRQGLGWGEGYDTEGCSHYTILFNISLRQRQWQRVWVGYLFLSHQ
jgi:hypothetical protein